MGNSDFLRGDGYDLTGITQRVFAVLAQNRFIFTLMKIQRDVSVFVSVAPEFQARFAHGGYCSAGRAGSQQFIQVGFVHPYPGQGNGDVIACFYQAVTV